MKITGPENLQQPQSGNIKPQEKGHQVSDFRDMLRETLSPTNSTSAVETSPSLPELRTVHNIARQTSSPVGFTDRTTHTIDLLDSYSKSLGNPQKTLRDIEPELSAFVSEAQSLYEDYLKTDRDDPTLKGIVEDLQRTAQLESIRFQRGDYLDSE